MHYHIGNMLIHQEFVSGNDCPLCRIRNQLEEQLCDQYLNESVMNDECRKEVNELGFCLHHTDMMFARRNKLSLALQLTTRITTLKNQLEITANPKTAKKLAEKFIHSNDTCVICNKVEDHMIRYYKTIAEMFCGEEGFKEKFVSVDGFCLKHFAELLNVSKYAKSKEKDFIYSLCKIEKESIERVLVDLNRFAAKHDYRNIDMPWNGAENAVPHAITKLHGIQSK